MTRVQIDGLAKSFDGVASVDGVSVEIRQGEMLAILGPSGAGKTTLARLIAGLETPDVGDIRLDGRSLSGVDPSQRKVGFVPQGDALWPQLSVGENVGYGLRLKRIARRERRSRVAEALGSARIDSLLDRLPETLSPLQRQRVALARALIAEPELLVVDDPSSRLDARSRSEFREDVRRVHAESEVTTLVLSGDPREALALGDRLAVMDLGRVIQVGAPPDVYNRPLDVLVAQLLGPANLLQGHAEVKDSRGELVVKTSIGRLVGRCVGEAPSAGTPVTIVMRPESLGIGPIVPQDANRFTATVERQVFLGSTRQISLRGPNDWPILATALQAVSSGLREGQSVTVSVMPEMVVILPSKSTRAAPNG